MSDPRQIAVDVVPIDDCPIVGNRRRHQEMLVVALGVIALSFLLDVHADQRVAFRYLPGIPMPETCLSRGMFGVRCPGCGLTRSFVYLAHGELLASLEMHRVGWLLAAAILFQIPYRSYALLYGDVSPATLFAYRIFGYVLIGLLVLNWLCLYLPSRFMV
jgi:hypothetical protein